MYVARLRDVGEAHLVADPLAERRAKLGGHSRGDRTGRDATGLRVADQSVDAPSERKADLGELRRFAGTRFAANDHYRMLSDCFGDGASTGCDRQRFVESHTRQRSAAGRPQLDRAG